MLALDLALLRTPGAPALTPDGRLAVVAVTWMDLDADAYRGRLWAVPLDPGDPPRPLTHGWRDAQPQVSPDGRQLAFTRVQAEGGKPQVHVMPLDGGEARRLTDLPLGVERVVWAPDSRRLAVTARVPEPGRYGTEADRTPEREAPRRITTLHYRWDDIGFLVDRPRHVFVLDVAAQDAEPERVTTADRDHDHPLWLADGRLLVTRDHDMDRVLRTDLVVLDAAGGDEQVVALPLWVEAPLVQEAAGTLLAAGVDTGPQGRDFAGRPASLYRVDLSGGAPERLTDPAHVELATDRMPVLDVRPDGSVLYAVLHRGAVHLVRRPADGPVETLLRGPRQVLGWASAGATVVACVADGTSAGELVRVGTDEALTGFGGDLRARDRLHPLHEVDATAADGYPVHGWVVLPRGPGPHPVLLMVHGGPHTQYGWTLLDEAQVYAGAGYAVVMGNPRGSAGYGQAHARAVVHAFGDRDAVDVLALLDAALERRPDLDRSRVGVLGGSYGGFMTAWLAAHHGDRFGAALVERGALALDSFVGSSDIGHWFVDAYNGSDPALVRRQSPLTHADRIRIPTLVVHSEHDWRCPVEQAQRLYVALKRNGVETELLLFPGEGHELSRSGLPSHRVARLDAVVEWFDRHLR